MAPPPDHTAPSGRRQAPPVDELVATGRAAGLAALGVAPAEPFERTRGDLEERKAAGLHGGMQFTYRNPARSTEPSRILDGAMALVVGAYGYRREAPEADSDAARPVARVARYAWEDHYARLRDGLDAVADVLRAGGWRAVVVADSNALVDREAAVRAGIGWYGKSSNVLLPGAGSWFVLGSVVTDAPLAPAAEPVEDGCGGCRRCLDGCPTGAIVAPGVVDARRCLAWLVQADGPFPVEWREALGDRIYGCDDCQEVCPPNRRRRGEPAAASPPDAEAEVDLLELLAASDDDLLARHGRWYIPRREPRYLRRNALVALANTATGDHPDVAATLTGCLRDDDPLVRAHAVWAARRLGREDLLAMMAPEDDPDVCEELARR
ncbi:MAG: tRNA epoxyqueuosine(34) reductase QueG [Actinomycetota bacterium]|nr:tRNA epoxyqueuosine(34) reductase QueG [Actinomycetota bacterium]